MILEMWNKKSFLRNFQSYIQIGIFWKIRVMYENKTGIRWAITNKNIGEYKIS